VNRAKWQEVIDEAKENAESCGMEWGICEDDHIAALDELAEYISDLEERLTVCRQLIAES
jgi:hypothetical protein